MDSPAPTYLPAPDPLATTLHHATIDKAEKNEFTNTARDMFKFVLNYNQNSPPVVPAVAGLLGQVAENGPVHEFHDAINYLLNIVPHFLEEVRKNNQSRSTASETTGTDGSDPEPQCISTDHTTIPDDPVDIIDIVPPEPSELPVANIADRYTRSMLKCLVGYPLYDPIPFSDLSKAYPRTGVNVGDVGFVRESGTFDFLFNICPSKDGLINPPNLPDGFSLEMPDHSITRDLEQLPHSTCLFQSPITKTRSREYICEGSEGAVLELPEGAIQSEATNIRPFAKLAARHGVQWYEYTMSRGREVSNGSLYLITSVTKCAQWGIAVFDRPCTPGQGLRFDKKRSLPFGKPTSKYHWKGSHALHSKVSDADKEDALNQCVFLRGYKIMIRPDIFNNLYNDQPRNITMTRQPATRIRGGGGTDFMRLRGVSLLSRVMKKSDEEVMLHPNFNSSNVHPSDLVNAALLNQNPGAKIAITHDEVWCDLLRGVNYAMLINIARSYMNTVDEYDCVSLEKISDSRNVLDESISPIQEIETGIQGPLTIPDDDCTPASVTVHLTLPHELVERILLLLDNKSMLTCRLVNREFNEIIQSSTLLQYFIACKAACVVNNSQSPLNYAERLEALRKHGDAWRKLKPVFKTTIKVFDQLSTFYELTAGNYFISDNDRKDLYYCPLPSSSQDKPEWIKILAHGPGQSQFGFVIDMGRAVYEHDLIVNVISSEIGNEPDTQRYSLDLVFLKFSTGEYHPLARHPRIHVQRSSSPRPLILPTIVGDNLALIVNSQNDSFQDRLFIFDWKTGRKRLQHEATNDAYSTVVFISPELLLVPNRFLSLFEVWQLLPDANPPVQILSLQFPRVSNNCSVINIDCHGESSTFLRSMPYFPPRSFSPSPEHSIIIFNFLFQSYPGPDRYAYTLIVRRCALLDTIQKWTSPSLLEQQNLPWWTNEITVNQVADLDDESVIRLATQSKFREHLPDAGSSSQARESPNFATCQDFSAFFTSHTSTTDSGVSSIPPGSSVTTSFTSQYDIPHVEWADWGPLISRWFEVSDTHAEWINQSSGTRYVFLDPNSRNRTKCKIHVADFNPYNVRGNAEMMAQLRGGEDKGGNSRNEEEKKESHEEMEILDHPGVFLEDVYMGLKCVVYHTPDEYEFDSVLMDEERLLGLKADRTYRVESIDVLYIG